MLVARTLTSRHHHIRGDVGDVLYLMRRHRLESGRGGVGVWLYKKLKLICTRTRTPVDIAPAPHTRCYHSAHLSERAFVLQACYSLNTVVAVLLPVVDSIAAVDTVMFRAPAPAQSIIYQNDSVSNVPSSNSR